MIEVKNISKRFGSKVAVDDVSFEVQKGEVLGFLGPNGAGKSTTMRIITGFITATEGIVRVGGLDILENELAVKEKVGYLPESAPLYSDMTVFDFLRYAAEIRGLEGAAMRKAIDRVMDLCFLEPVRFQSIDTLSKGYRHRTCLAQALIHDPEVLIMDEPTDGLDPNQKHEVRGLIRRMGEEKAIIFSTHILEEVEAACSRAIIIDQGKIIANGTPDELKARSATAGRVRLSVFGENTKGFREAVEAIPAVERAEVIELMDDGMRLEVHPGKKNGDLGSELFDLAVSKDVKVGDLHVDEGQLDELFRSLTTSDR